MARETPQGVTKHKSRWGKKISKQNHTQKDNFKSKSMHTQKQKQKAIIIKTEKHTPTSHNLVQLVHLFPQLVLQDKIETHTPLPTHTHTHTHKLQPFY